MGHFTSLPHFMEVARLVDVGPNLFDDPALLLTVPILGGFVEFHAVTCEYRVIMDLQYDVGNRQPRQLELLGRYPWKHAILGPSHAYYGAPSKL